MANIIRKLSSRKLWMAVAGVATGVAMSLGVNATEIRTVSGAIMSIISVVVYIVVEGKIDAESVKKAIEDTQEAVEIIEGTDK